MILIVDDQIKNVELIEAYLIPEGYGVITAQSGAEALEKPSLHPIDLILLDIMMPGMNGFEVCKVLKGDPKTAPIPVMLLTSMHERENRLAGMAVGANDYLTKPIDKEELLLRVRNAVRAKRLHDEIQRHYEELGAMVKLRDNLIHMIVHDLRSPLTAVCGYLQMIPKESLESKHQLYLEKALEGSSRLSEMINALLDISRLEAGKMPIRKTRCDLGTLTLEAIEALGPQNDPGLFRLVVTGDPQRSACDPDIIRRVLANLLGNAVKFSPPGKEIAVEIACATGESSVRVTDRGPGIAPEFHHLVFEKFAQIEMQRRHQPHSTGLGLTFCKLAVAAHGGEIHFESIPGNGSSFWFTLPALASP